MHALKNPASESPFRNILDKNIAAIADLQNIFNKGNINQVTTKQIQAQPEIQLIENIPAKKLQTETNERDKGPHLIPPEEPSELPRVKPTVAPRVNPEGSPRVSPEGSPEIKIYSLRSRYSKSETKPRYALAAAQILDQEN